MSPAQANNLPGDYLSVGEQSALAAAASSYTYLQNNLGALGANATALAPASTALSSAVWTPTKAGYLDTNVGSRMATYAQPAGFLAATFPATLASPTNITSATGVTLGGSQATRPGGGGIADHWDGNLQCGLGWLAVVCGSRCEHGELAVVADRRGDGQQDHEPCIARTRRRVRRSSGRR